MKLALVVRGAEALARPAGSGDPVPSIDEVSSFITIIESTEYGDMVVVTSSTGSPPANWRWVSVSDLQRQSEHADLVGEALLCA